MATNPYMFRKILKELIGSIPAIIDAIHGIRQRLRKRKKDLPESEPLSEDIPATQEYEEKIDIFRNSLRQHVKVINRHSKVLAGHGKMLEEIRTQSENLAVQSENLAVQSKNLATLVNVLVWSTGISFVIAVIAILVALFK